MKAKTKFVYTILQRSPKFTMKNQVSKHYTQISFNLRESFKKKSYALTSKSVRICFLTIFRIVNKF